MASRIEQALNVGLTVAAVAIAVVVVRREIRDRAPRDHVHHQEQKPFYVNRWREMLSDGLQIGDASASVQIVEFADLECGFCARWHLTTFREIVEKHGTGVSYTMMHYPLPRNRFSMQAASAAECAAEQGRASEFLTAAYSKQDSIGLKTWAQFAMAAMVPDSSRFAECMLAPPSPRIQAGLSWGQRLGVAATPTFLINGWQLSRTPSTDEFLKLIEELLSGRTPFRS